MQGLPSPPTGFAVKKAKILSQLAVPDATYTDLSPKGSVDEGIRHLIAEINAVEGLVTTSSCAGRVSVFVEGRKTAGSDEGGDAQLAGVGGKGGGGNWLFVSHDPVEENDAWIQGLDFADEANASAGSAGRRLIHFKFEPMILHILTASPSHAQLVLGCALQAGFRESGAVNLIASRDEPVMPMVAVRSMGLTLESLIGQQVGEDQQQLVSVQHLRTLMSVANERFVENTKRIARFQHALSATKQPPPLKKNAEGQAWEDAAARRERKRAEGLRRKAEMQKDKHSPMEDTDEPVATDSLPL